MIFFKQLKEEVLELYRFRWVTYSFVRSNLLLRYRRSVLGFLWSLLNPILSYLVVGVVFYLLSMGSIPNYSVYLFAGSAIFNLFSVTTNSSPVVMLSNELYIKKIYLPKSIFIINSILLEAVNFLFSLAALLLLGLLFGKIQLNFTVFSIPFVFLFVMVLNFGVSALLSVAAVFFRDLVHIVPILTHTLFFATPILYTAELIPAKYHWALDANPFYHVVKCFRDPFYEGKLAPAVSYLVLIGCAVIFFIIGFLVLKKNENRIIFKL